jgi:hypothetical protein
MLALPHEAEDEAVVKSDGPNSPPRLSPLQKPMESRSSVTTSLSTSEMGACGECFAAG